MFASKYHINIKRRYCVKEKYLSQSLLKEAGLISKLSSGVYIYMPIGLKLINKIKNIIVEEMMKAGSIEILMPIIQPSNIWKISGRFKNYGLEIFKFKDRRNNEFILQPTSEEVVTDLTYKEINSWKKLPKNFFHIQTKFRDEIRPRFGLVRCREFIMKDSYSFDTNKLSSLHSYKVMHDTYIRIFNRIGLKFFSVPANNGVIGGLYSHEFQSTSNSGENLVLYEPSKEKYINIDLFKTYSLLKFRLIKKKIKKKIFILNIVISKLFKSFIYIFKNDLINSYLITSKSLNGVKNFFLILLRYDHNLNENKLSELPFLNNYFYFSSDSEANFFFKCQNKHLGPINNDLSIKLIADKTVARMSNFICSSNINNEYFTGLNWSKDIHEPFYITDLRNIVNEDLYYSNQRKFFLKKSIEVAHIFSLGYKYSNLFKANFINEFGNQKSIYMGCYGIGLNRILSAFIDQNNDKNGIIWSKSLNPFEVVICPKNFKNSRLVRKKTFLLYEILKKNKIDIILDDRNLRLGEMFFEWSFLGIPILIIINEKNLEKNLIEIQIRRSGKIIFCKLSNAEKYIIEKLKYI